MKQVNHITILAIVLLCIVACTDPADKSTDPIASGKPMTTATDPGKIKQDIQTLETAWATADNARDVNAVSAFYADDAVTLPNNKSMLAGKAAIRKDLEESIGKRMPGSTVTYEVVDAFGSSDFVTEVGIITNRDSTGKVFYTGKYMAVWQLRDGKYTCIRDIVNDDVKGN